MIEINIAEVVAQLRVVATMAQAYQLLCTLPAATLRQVATAYDPYMVLRRKAGQEELVKALIHRTVGMRLWIMEYKGQQR